MARLQHHRRALVLSGEADWCRSAAEALLVWLGPMSVHWFSDRAPPGAPSSFGSAALASLGSEFDVLVFDAFAGFDPDAFGALTGCIRGGGMLVLLTPPLDRWAEFPDPQKARITVAPWNPAQVSGRYLKRLAGVIAVDADVMRCEGSRIVQFPEIVRQARGVSPVSGGCCATSDQQRAVAAIVKVASGHRRRPVVLTSDRGRGKSAAFGIAAAQLILEGHERILVTGPRADCASAVIKHARALLPDADHEKIAFKAPDELLQRRLSTDLLLVDEAAGIPTPRLASLLKRYSRIAFATTVHGYEGTGRGFAVRFTHSLDRFTNSWQSVVLSTPIRWAPDDPLERLVFSMLLMDADAASATDFADPRPEHSIFERVDRDSLLADDRCLSEVFGLLVLAHYRTRPLDLRHLLDGPNLSVFLVRVRQHVAAVALVAEEGGFDADTARAIWAGERRPHGHLLPETLAAHQGLLRAPRLRAARIVRVAVHPTLQRRGFGTKLIEYVCASSSESGVDYMGCSFGTTEQVFSFWDGLAWLPVRVSIQAGASSGHHSTVMLKGISDQGVMLVAEARERFFANFPHQLSDSLSDLDPRLAALLMRGNSLPGSLSASDWLDLHAFAFHRRLAEVAMGSLWRLACRVVSEQRPQVGLNDSELAMLVARILQKRSWAACTALTGTAGRREALEALRSAVRKAIGYYRSDVNV
jgi:tRNA(Met) cytidine acetyltransferase